MYIPSIKFAAPRRRYRLGAYTAVLLGDIESVGFVEYRYILAVRRDEDQLPCLFIASEVNESVERFGGGSHFLGVFDVAGHDNLGASDEWADMERFASEALAIAAARLGIEDSPRMLPL